jgi:NAD(P)-dependent dehydrogenase (short-subunit alcohol dehydrogenase family)
VFCLDIAHPAALPPNTSYLPVEHATLSDDTRLHSKITSRLPPLSLVVSVAGGWVGGGVNSSSFCSDVQLCLGQNITAAAAAASISSKLLQKNGLLVLTGSTAALAPSPSMIAYSTSKAALHYMVQSIAQDTSSFAENVKVIGLLPTSIGVHYFDVAGSGVCCSREM